MDITTQKRTFSGQIDVLDARAEQLSNVIFCDAQPREVMSRRAQMKTYVKLLWHEVKLNSSNSKQKAQIIRILRVKIDICAYILNLR